MGCGDGPADAIVSGCQNWVWILKMVPSDLIPQTAAAAAFATGSGKMNKSLTPGML
jgi:hypothetical protein